VQVTCREDRLDNINQVFDRMKHGDIEGRVVMRIGAEHA
jgi:alcohol dehydrogenase, propanol-preferring